MRKGCEGQLDMFAMLGNVIAPLPETEQHPPKKRNCAATNEVCNHENCKQVAIECLGIECTAECCQACTEMCGARCNYSAHQPKKLNTETKEWVEVPAQTSTEVTQKSCSNCLRFNMDIEQPPAGWGNLGWCAEHNHKTQDISYCDSWEPKPVEVMSYSAKDYIQAMARYFIKYCREWGMSEKIEQLRANRRTETFHKLFCQVSRTFFVPLGTYIFDMKVCKDNTVEIKRCGRDYRDRPLDATIQLQDVLDELGD